MLKAYTIICLSLFCSSILFSQRLNRYNKKGERIGKWIIYLDSAKKERSFKGRFRHGKNVGRAYYYDLQGHLERIETNRFKKLKTVCYYPDGKIRSRGMARVENLPDKIHYYFYGVWKYYDEQGEIFKYCYYTKGNLIKTVYIGRHPEIDTLSRILTDLDKDFTAKNIKLINSIGAADPVKSEIYRQQLYKADSTSFIKTGNFLINYGYPGSLFEKEVANIPFFILSYGTIAIREKYLDILKIAATRNDLSWSSLAYYIDKLQIAKGEKQVYGTQYYFDKQKEMIYYPSIDPDNLEKRQAEAGVNK